MLITVRAIVEKDGRLRLLEKINHIKEGGSVLVTIAASSSEEDSSDITEMFEKMDPAHNDLSLKLVSESALADYWDNPEEDEAWADL